MKLIRILLFIIGCIGVRLYLVYIAKNISIKYLPYLGLLTLIPSLGFFYIYFTNGRKTGPEVFGEKIWWNHLRPIHGLLYGIFSIAAFMHINVWFVLLIDVIIGLSSYVFHYI